MASSRDVALISSTVALVLVASAVFFKQRKSFDDEPTRCAKYTCECGKIQADISIPPANYRYIEIPSLQCLCNDCAGFVIKVRAHAKPSSSMSFFSPGVSNLVLLDSEIQLTSGAELLRSMKLSNSTRNRRIYSTCCATPIAISIMGTGVTLIYKQNIKNSEAINSNMTNIPDLKPMVCFHVNGKAKQQDFPDLELSRGPFAPTAILRCLTHMACIALLGKKGPGKGFPLEGHLDIGVDSIADRLRSS